MSKREEDLQSAKRRLFLKRAARGALVVAGVDAVGAGGAEVAKASGEVRAYDEARNLNAQQNGVAQADDSLAQASNKASNKRHKAFSSVGKIGGMLAAMLTPLQVSITKDEKIVSQSQPRRKKADAPVPDAAPQESARRSFLKQGAIVVTGLATYKTAEHIAVDSFAEGKIAAGEQAAQLLENTSGIGPISQQVKKQSRDLQTEQTHDTANRSPIAEIIAVGGITALTVNKLEQKRLDKAKQEASLTGQRR